VAAGYRTAYGLDWAGGRMVLARSGGRDGADVLVSAALDSEAAREALAAAVREVERGSAALAVSAPATRTVVRRLRAPFASARKASRIWPSLLDVELPFPVEGALCVYGRPRVAEGATFAVAAAIREEDWAATDESCAAAGIPSTHGDVEAAALWDQFTVELPPVRADTCRLLVWLGTDYAVVVRGRSGELTAVHVLRRSPLAEEPAERDAFDQLWARRFGPILATHLAESDAAELDVWWAGPGAEDGDRLARLRQAAPAGMAVRHETVRRPAALLARALARRAAAGTGLNFKTGRHANPVHLRMEARQRRRAWLGVAAAALLVLALNAGEALQRRYRARRLQDELTAAAESIAGMAVPRGQEALMVERAQARRDEETRPFRTALDPEGLESVLAGVLADLDDLKLDVSRLSLSSLAVAVEGSAPAIQAVEALEERLHAAGWSVQGETLGQTPDGRQGFVLKGTALP